MVIFLFLLIQFTNITKTLVFLDFFTKRAYFKSIYICYTLCIHTYLCTNTIFMLKTNLESFKPLELYLHYNVVLHDPSIGLNVFLFS